MFFKGMQREGVEAKLIDWMSGVFNDDHPRRGMAFAIGNVARRPQTWQLLGVLRVDETSQGSLL